jgi:DNA-binding response OmpR family regulator
MVTSGVEGAAAPTIMLVDDDPDVERTLTRALETSGYRVVSASTAADARAMLLDVHPDLIILDLVLPDTDGLLLTPALQGMTEAPILICSARHTQVDRVLGLKLGADGFLAKPFDLDELEARIEAILRRSARARSEPKQADVRVGDLLIVPSRATVEIANRPVHLTPTEFRLLLILASEPAGMFTRESLTERVWGYHDVNCNQLVGVHVGRLRSKLRMACKDMPFVVTVRGRGYRLIEPPPESVHASASS